MKIVEIAIWIVIALALFGTLGTMITQSTGSATTVQTFTQPATAPTDFKLSGYQVVSLTSVTNGTTAIDPTNYTLSTALGNNILTIKENATYLGGTDIVVTYEANATGQTTGVSAVMIGLITLLVIAGVIAYIRRQTMGGK